MSLILRRLFFVGDLAILNLSLFVSTKIGPGIESTEFNVVYLIIFSNLAWIFLILISFPYETTKGLALSKVIKSQIAFVGIHILVIFTLVFIFDRSYSYLQIIIIYGVLIPLYFIFRFFVFYVRRILIEEPPRIRYVLVGRNQLSSDIRKFYLLNPDLGYQFAKYFELNGGSIELDELQNYCSLNNVNEIFVCATRVNKQQLDDLVLYGLNSLIRVKIIFQNDNKLDQSVQFEAYDKLPGVDLATIALDEPRNRFIKRLFDFTFSLFVFMIILLWLIPLIAILIKLSSKGPIFFIQQRNGEGNKPFGCIKFRTMTVNQEADTKQATKNDSRITQIGKFLRKSSIDELPQFINVLKGEMSLIGPRPHPIKLNEKFAPLISSLMSRHYVKPGITGLAQCMGYRGETQTLADMENRVRLDRYYIENWSFWLDIKIIFLTIVSLIRGSDKAY